MAWILDLDMGTFPITLSAVSVANMITGANAGGRRQVAMRTRWVARVAQLHC